MGCVVFVNLAQQVPLRRAVVERQARRPSLEVDLAGGDGPSQRVAHHRGDLRAREPRLAGQFEAAISQPVGRQRHRGNLGDIAVVDAGYRHVDRIGLGEDAPGQDARPCAEQVLVEIRGLQHGELQARIEQRLFDRNLAGVVGQRDVGRLDHRREHEAAHTGTPRCVDHVDAQLRFVGREGGADVEHTIDAVQRGRQRLWRAQVANRDLVGAIGQRDGGASRIADQSAYGHAPVPQRLRNQAGESSGGADDQHAARRGGLGRMRCCRDRCHGVSPRS